jgi:hypothetical protein
MRQQGVGSAYIQSLRDDSLDIAGSYVLQTAKSDQERGALVNMVAEVTHNPAMGMLYILHSVEGLTQHVEQLIRTVAYVNGTLSGLIMSMDDQSTKQEGTMQ